MEQPEPVLQRYLDITLPSGGALQITLWPTDTVETLIAPTRLLVRFREKVDETLTLYLGPGTLIRESTGLYRPPPLDETGRPRQFQTLDEYRAYLAEQLAERTR